MLLKELELTRKSLLLIIVCLPFLLLSCSSNEKFIVADFKEPAKFISKLRDATQETNTVSLYLKGKLSENFQQRIKAYRDGEALSKAFLDTLVGEFNSLLEKSLYQQEIFAKVELSEETKALLASKNPKDIKGEDLLKFNRLLLEDTYPYAIAKRYKSEIQTLKGENQTLKSQIAQLQKQLSSITTPPPEKGKGNLAVLEEKYKNEIQVLKDKTQTLSSQIEQLHKEKISNAADLTKVQQSAEKRQKRLQKIYEVPSYILQKYVELNGIINDRQRGEMVNFANRFLEWVSQKEE